MISLVRTIISLDQKQLQAVDGYAKSKGVSRAQVVREALTAYLPATKPGLNLQNHPAFGSWKGPKVDGVTYIRKLRSEWDKRR